MGYDVTVAWQVLILLVWVRLLVPQPRSGGSSMVERWVSTQIRGFDSRPPLHLYKEANMFDLLFWVAVGLVIGWNLPQPWWAKLAQEKIVAKIRGWFVKND